MPATGARFGITKLSDPAQNIRAGMAFTCAGCWPT